MSFLKNIFKKKEGLISSYFQFWEWFEKNESVFHKLVKQGNNIEKGFFKPLSIKLDALRPGFFYLTGMADEQTVELIFTADGNIKNIVFVEELVASAPKINGWQFRALKPAININDLSIKMNGCNFKSENINFYPNTSLNFQDEIDITVVHDDLNEENKSTIENGVYIFLDNFLGELDFATTIDNLIIIGKANVDSELVPIAKLPDFLIWRQKEFLEKYEGTRRDTNNDSYSLLEAKLENGSPLLATINIELLNWDCKASHPWLLNVEIKFDGSKQQGMPDSRSYELLNIIEDDILAKLKDFEGYLNIGRETTEGVRNIYFACKEFRTPSKVLENIKQKYKSKIELDFSIYKDKYWQSLNRFTN
jgi:hypothetical protein